MLCQNSKFLNAKITTFAQQPRGPAGTYENLLFTHPLFAFPPTGSTLNSDKGWS